MPNVSAVARLSDLSVASGGVFRGCDAVRLGVTRKQLHGLRVHGVIERVHPDIYRMTAAPRSGEQRLRAALLWAGDVAAAADRSAGELSGLEGIRAELPDSAEVARGRDRETSFGTRPAEGKREDTPTGSW